MSDRRLAFLRGKLAEAEKRKSLLEMEADELDKRMLDFRHHNKNLWQDRLWSAMVHRKSRLPVLIKHVENEIAVVHSDLRKHHRYH